MKQRKLYLQVYVLLDGIAITAVNPMVKKALFRLTVKEDLYPEYKVHIYGTFNTYRIDVLIGRRTATMGFKH